MSRNYLETGLEQENVVILLLEKDICHQEGVNAPIREKNRCIRKMNKKKATGYIVWGSLIIVTFLTGGSYLKLQKLQTQIAGKVLRFHVLANSDSTEDQQLKLEVRDAVGSYMQQMFSEELPQDANLRECEEMVKEHIPEIKEIATEVISDAGYDYEVAAAVEKTEFPVKTYGSYTFPAGEYEALRLTIGAGEGHNWWCVMYPNMCFSDGMYEVVDEEAEEALRKVLDKEEYEAVLQSGNYEIRFKYLTFLNEMLAQTEEKR